MNKAILTMGPFLPVILLLVGIVLIVFRYLKEEKGGKGRVLSTIILVISILSIFGASVVSQRSIGEVL